MPSPLAETASGLNPMGAAFMVLSIGGVLTLLIYCYRRILTAEPVAPEESEASGRSSDAAPRVPRGGGGP